MDTVGLGTVIFNLKSEKMKLSNAAGEARRGFTWHDKTGQDVAIYGRRGLARTGGAGLGNA